MIDLGKCASDETMNIHKNKERRRFYYFRLSESILDQNAKIHLL
jgi:hypothetical protein